MQARSLASCDTVYSADAIEFHPDPENDLFVCGTYQIQQETMGEAPRKRDGSAEDDEDDDEQEDEGSSPPITRYGRCLLYHFDRKSSKLTELQRFDGPAILDMKWSPMPYRGRTTLAIADAKGHVQLHSFEEGSNRFSHLETLACTSESTLCLSLDWSTRNARKGPADLVVSLSSGEICTLAATSDSAASPDGIGGLQVLDTWQAHDYEAWIAAFDGREPNTVWTGGDDLKLKGWDLRQGCVSPTFVNKRSPAETPCFPPTTHSFEGGVTSIQSHPTLDHLFVVGSYDAHIRLFDKRKPLVPLTTYDAGGGIWRLKWHREQVDRLLVACMHDGFKVVEFGEGMGEGKGECVLKTRFDGHESLAYGVDWGRSFKRKGEEEGAGDVVASCSFYDHMLHVWEAK
ncbi:BZ3500_MvSof-1268-A1-R1_Chr1-3g02203 [Microbotryum saponariae]|uniref:methylated diphthine methylhydrolase n=1 Tax=Microbotryum saponariae TaxID=289078 RepID=A0A2X0MSY9_9BASI|nr:BZ3500_MvSof-1268-A1-R1_Chr1-3g02203 [Microbotryum saponariae]SCZ95644.1 BZ3501_MvSof-1269-A2-R1_Chr1-3g01806 [Microbotryum saponariae]